MKNIAVVLFLTSFCHITCTAQKDGLHEDLIKSYLDGIDSLDIPAFTYDYRTYLRRIPPKKSLIQQENFFRRIQNQIKELPKAASDAETAIQIDHLNYICTFNLNRIRLETDWLTGGGEIKSGGLFYLSNHEEWYAHFIQKSTTLQLSPKDIMAYGRQEVKRINAEIDLIRSRKGYHTLDEMYQALGSDSLYLTDKAEINLAFLRVDSLARSKMKNFIGQVDIPPVFPMEWPGAGSHTPPGIYLHRSQNSLGQDVFQYNFYGERYSVRMIEWLYIHEAIPGHHLQASIRAQQRPDRLQSESIYPGNFEGWACYAEYQCRDLGMLQDDLQYLGWLEWELVRSVRLVLEAGIHAQGWSKEMALQYWKENIFGQDDIADREITRVSNWPGQALSYKMGARFLENLFNKYRQFHISDAQIHYAFLRAGMRPLPLIESHLDTYLTSQQ